MADVPETPFIPTSAFTTAGDPQPLPGTEHVLALAADTQWPRYIDAGSTTVSAAYRYSNGSIKLAAVKPGDTVTDLGRLLTDWLAADPKNLPTPFVDLPTLQKFKDGICARIDADAERCRLLFVTPGSAQNAVYTAKADEATRALADTEANAHPERYPLLAASLGLEGDTIVAVATGIDAIQAAWRQVAAAIERLRLGNKQQVKLATTTAQIQALYDALVWPKP